MFNSLFYYNGSRCTLVNNITHVFSQLVGQITNDRENDKSGKDAGADITDGHDQRISATKKKENAQISNVRPLHIFDIIIIVLSNDI